MGTNKSFELGEWVFEINFFDVEKATSLLPELVCIFSKPISTVVDKFTGDMKGKGEESVMSSNVMEHAGKLFESLDLLFTGYLKPAEVPVFLKRILEEVRCKKKGVSNATFANLSDVYNIVFAGRIMDQFLLAKEVLMFNFQAEWQRFFGLLLGSSGTTDEVQAKSQAISQRPVTIKAR